MVLLRHGFGSAASSPFAPAPSSSLLSPPAILGGPKGFAPAGVGMEGQWAYRPLQGVRRASGRLGCVRGHRGGCPRPPARHGPDVTHQQLDPVGAAGLGQRDQGAEIR